MSTFYPENIKYCELIRKERLSGLIITHNYPSTVTCINSSYACLRNPNSFIRPVAQTASNSTALICDLPRRHPTPENPLLCMVRFEGSHFCAVTTQNAHVEQYYRLTQVNDKSLNGYHDSTPASYTPILGHTELEQHIVINQRMFEELGLSQCLKRSLVHRFLYIFLVSLG